MLYQYKGVGLVTITTRIENLIHFFLINGSLKRIIILFAPKVDGTKTHLIIHRIFLNSYYRLYLNALVITYQTPTMAAIRWYNTTIKNTVQAQKYILNPFAIKWFPIPLKVPCLMLLLSDNLDILMNLVFFLQGYYPLIILGRKTR